MPNDSIPGRIVEWVATVWWKDLNFLRRGAARRAAARAKAIADAAEASRVAAVAVAPVAPPKKAIPAELEAPVPPERVAAIRAAAVRAAASNAKTTITAAAEVGQARARPGRILPLTPQREALILDAMKQWAHGHEIFLRLDRRVREQIRAIAEKLAPP